MARAFHEAYGVRSIAYGKYPSFPCHGSAIIDYRVCPDNESADAFRRNAKAVAEEFPDKTILLLGCGDSYVQLAAHCKDQLPANVVAPYIDGALLDTLINKEKFYQLCDRYGVDHPATFIYDKSMGHDFSLPFGPPYIAKPADSVAYWATGVHALAKVYICQTWEELLAALDQVYAAGYPDHMVLQEFIPGDDTYMRVLTNYSDRNGQVKLMCLGHVLLEEHSPHGIGNHAVILTEHDEELSLKIKGMRDQLPPGPQQLLCHRLRPQHRQAGGGGPGGAQGPALCHHPGQVPVADGAQERGLRLHPQALPQGDEGAHPGGKGLPLPGV